MWNKKFELMLTGRAKAYSSSCSQTVSLSPAISSRLLRGYCSLMPSCAGFLPSVEIYVQCWKFHVQRVRVCFKWFRRNSFLQCVSQPKIAKKIHKTPYFGVQGYSGSLNWGTNREPVYDSLLVINSNLGPISHRYWDTATYWPKVANFAHPL